MKRSRVAGAPVMGERGGTNLLKNIQGFFRGAPTKQEKVVRLPSSDEFQDALIEGDFERVRSLMQVSYPRLCASYGHVGLWRHVNWKRLSIHQ
jgi:hypothetical protein